MNIMIFKFDYIKIEGDIKLSITCIIPFVANISLYITLILLLIVILLLILVINNLLFLSIE